MDMKIFKELKEFLPKNHVVGIGINYIYIKGDINTIIHVPFLLYLKNYFEINSISFDNNNICIRGTWKHKIVTIDNLCILLGINEETIKISQIKLIKSNKIWISKEFELTGSNIVMLENYLSIKVKISADTDQNIILSWSE